MKDQDQNQAQDYVNDPDMENLQFSEQEFLNMVDGETLGTQWRNAVIITGNKLEKRGAPRSIADMDDADDPAGSLSALLAALATGGEVTEVYCDWLCMDDKGNYFAYSQVNDQREETEGGYSLGPSQAKITELADFESLISFAEKIADERGLDDEQKAEFIVIAEKRDAAIKVMGLNTAW